MSLYTADETEASFIVDAKISYTNGQPYYNTTYDEGAGHSVPFSRLFIDIAVADMGLDLVSHANVSINSTSNELQFSLNKIPARMEPYTITLTGASQDGDQSYNAETQLWILPSRSDGGSVTKVDSLYGGLLAQDILTDSTAWTPLFPYSYYVSWDGWLEKSINNVDIFKSYGYNMIHIVPNAGLPNAAFNFTELDMFLERCDELGLWVMFDMRWTYKNLSAVEYQVNQLKTRKSLLLWYTGDEPDGATDPLNATKLAYDTIKSLDPWHPVSLVLNCYNFYYEEYTSGADIILSDVYPIGTNTSFSGPWGTICNTTYGDCGCDDCNGNFEDISIRLDRFAEYQYWIDGPPKTFWGVPMAFGNESYWSRYPTADEEVVMNMLSINHNAKAIVMWDFPTQPDLASTTGQLSRTLVAQDVTSFLVGSATIPLQANGADRIDAAGWTVGSQMLVSVVFLQYDDAPGDITIALPESASSIASISWGAGGWNIEGGMLVKKGLTALEVDLLTLNLS